MCLTCGCMEPMNRHGQDFNPIYTDIETAAEWAKISTTEAADNVVATTRKALDVHGKTVVGIGQGTQVNVEHTGWFSTGDNPGTRELISDPRVGSAFQQEPMTSQQMSAVRQGISDAGGIGYIAVDVANQGGYNRVTGAGGGLIYSQDQEQPTSTQIATIIRDANVAAGGSIQAYQLADLIKRFGDEGSTQQQDAHGRFTVGSGAPRDASSLKYPELHARDMSAGGTNSPLMTRAEFQASAARGEDIVNNAIANSSPPVNLMTGPNIQAAVDAAQQEWGCVTIDAHGGGVVSQASQPPDPVSVSMRDAGQGSVIVSAAAVAADPGALMAAMQQAQTQFADQLSAQGAALGMFRDMESGTTQFDPVLVVQGVSTARDVGAYTGATGGAYRFSDGLGFWPGHVADGPVPIQANVVH